MSVTTICDHCQKPMDLQSFNMSQTSVTFQYHIGIFRGTSPMDTPQDVCPHCAIAILQQLVAAWGG